MGNKLARLNINPSNTFGTKDVEKIWHVYDPKNKGYLTQEEARQVSRPHCGFFCRSWHS